MLSMQVLPASTEGLKEKPVHCLSEGYATDTPITIHIDFERMARETHTAHD